MRSPVTHPLPVCLAVALIVILAVTPLCLGSPSIKESPASMTLQDVESLQMVPPADYLDRLQPVIRSSPDPELREAAVQALAAIAVEKKETGKAGAVLKEAALHDTNGSVRSAALAGYDLIRQLSPTPSRGTLDITVEGPVRRGGNVTIVTIARSSVDAPQALVGIPSHPIGITFQPPYSRKFPLRAGVPEVSRFSLVPEKDGTYLLEIRMLLSFDTIEYEELERTLMLRVDGSTGTWDLV